MPCVAVLQGSVNIPTTGTLKYVCLFIICLYLLSIIPLFSAIRSGECVYRNF